MSDPLLTCVAGVAEAECPVIARRHLRPRPVTPNGRIDSGRDPVTGAEWTRCVAVAVPKSGKVPFTRTGTDPSDRSLDRLDDSPRSTRPVAQRHRSRLRVGGGREVRTSSNPAFRNLPTSPGGYARFGNAPAGMAGGCGVLGGGVVGGGAPPATGG